VQFLLETAFGNNGKCGGDKKCTQGFGEEILLKESLGRLRQRWENNSKVNLKATGCGGVDWVHLAEKRGTSYR